MTGVFPLGRKRRRAADRITPGAPTASVNNPRTVTYTEWKAEGESLFGPDRLKWRFVCPACGHVASVQDWREIGAAEECIAFSCIGRWIKGSRQAFGKGGGPCNYAGGGLFRLNPVTVITKDGDGAPIFEFDRSGRPYEPELTKVDEVSP